MLCVLFFDFFFFYSMTILWFMGSFFLEMDCLGLWRLGASESIDSPKSHEVYFTIKIIHCIFQLVFCCVCVSLERFSHLIFKSSYILCHILMSLELKKKKKKSQRKKFCQNFIGAFILMVPPRWTIIFYWGWKKSKRQRKVWLWIMGFC